MPNKPEGAVPELPDLVAEGLDVLFVGINPSIYSALHGHYFARPGNRFWPALSRSVLSRPARQGLAVAALGPQHDRSLLAYGIGFTDVVKRPSAKASEVAPAEFAAGVRALAARIERVRPRIACFHGVTGYRHFHRALAGGGADIALGPQDLRLGPTALFLVPNPSGANAHFTPAEQTDWYDRLAAALRAPGGNR